MIPERIIFVSRGITVHPTGHDRFIRRRSQIEAIPWHRRLVAGLSPPKPPLHLLQPRPVRVGFVVDRVTLKKASLRLLRCVPVNIVPPVLHSHAVIRRCVILSFNSVVK